MSTVVKRVTWSLEIRLLDKSHVCRLGHDICLSSNKGRYSAAAFFHQKDVLHKTPHKKIFLRHYDNRCAMQHQIEQGIFIIYNNIDMYELDVIEWQIF